MLLNVAEIHTIGCDLGIFRVSVLDKQADDRWFHLEPGSRNASPRSELQVAHVLEVPGFFRYFDARKAHCVTAFEKGCPFPTVSDHCKGQSLESSRC